MKITSSLVLAAVLMTGCVGMPYLNSVTDRDIRSGFIGSAKTSETVQLLQEPLVLLAPGGCKKSGGVVPPPLVFDVTFPMGEHVKLSGEPALVLKDGSKARFSLKNIPRVDGVDRIQMYFMAVCSDLNGAELRLPPIEVRASQHVVPPVTFEYTESKHTELKRLPDQFWK